MRCFPSLITSLLNETFFFWIHRGSLHSTGKFDFGKSNESSGTRFGILAEASDRLLNVKELTSKNRKQKTAAILQLSL